MDAAGAIGASALAESEPAAFEVAEELVPTAALDGDLSSKVAHYADIETPSE